jgi:hypothetical protein
MLTAAIAHLSTYRRQDFVELIMALTARRPSGDTTRMLLEDAASGHARKLQAALGVKTRSYRSRLILP